jgi:hypothetical protein
MAVLSLESFERFGWTTYDFIVLRPREFFARRAQEPDRYFAPLPFLVAWFVLYETGILAIAAFGAQLWDWSYVLGLSGAGEAATINVPDTPTAFLPLAAIGVVFMYTAWIAWMKAGARIMRRRLLARDAVVALSYASASFLLIFAYAGFALFVGLLFAFMGAERDARNAVGRFFYLGLQFASLGTVLVYYLPAASALSGIPSWRIAVGMLLAAVILFAAEASLLALAARLPAATGALPGRL